MIKVNPKGAFFELKSNDEFVWNILATDVEFGPDGGMYVSDWVNGWNGENKGRIYRFADEKAQASDLVKSTHGLLRDGMKLRGAIELGELLGHADRRVRLEALDMLAQWAKPGDRDRVMNLHQPLSDRDPEIAVKVLKERIEELSATPPRSLVQTNLKADTNSNNVTAILCPMA